MADGFWRRVGAVFRPSTAATFDSAPRPIDQVIMEFKGLGTATSISRTEALTVPAVQRGRNLICSISTLPLVQRGPNNEIARSSLLEQIDPDVPNVVTLAMTVEDLLFEGIAWWQILAIGSDKFPMSARRLDPGTVSLDPPRKPSRLPSGYDADVSVVWVDGKEVPINQMIRFDSPNPPVLRTGGRAIRRAILLDKAATMYADDPRPLDYFMPADGADPIEDDDIRDLLGMWKTSRKEVATAYVPASLRYNQVNGPSPQELQLVELQRQAGLEIANALGVDPEELGISTTSRTYFNATDRRQSRINDVLSPYMRAVTDRLSMGDVTKRGYVVQFDLDNYMRADPLTRAAFYSQMLVLGAMTVEEIRVEEKKPPLPAQPAPETPAPEAVDE